MFLHIGGNFCVAHKDIVMIMHDKNTKNRAIIITDNGSYQSSLTVGTLVSRLADNHIKGE